MSNHRYTTVPEPPDQLSQEARKTWYMEGLTLVKEKRFTDEAYELLSDLCYWEEQKLSTLERLRTVQAGPGSVTPQMTRSVALKNLKTIKIEIDQLRAELDIEQHESAWISETQPISGDAYSSLPVPLAACCELLNDPAKRDLFLLTFLPAVSAFIPNVLAEHANGFYSASLNIFMIDKSGMAGLFAGKALRLADRAADLQDSPAPGLWQSSADAIHHRDRAGEEFRDRPHAIYESELQTPGEASEPGDTLNRQQQLLFEYAIQVVPKQVGRIIAPVSNSFIGDDDQYRIFRTRFDGGVLSSFLVYCGKNETAWQSHRPDAISRSLNAQLDELKNFLFGLNDALLMRDDPLILELADNQWQMIDDTFAEKMEIIEELALPSELKKANYNAAIYALKLTLIFSAVRWFDDDPGEITSRDYIVPDDNDVIASLWIADTCLKHAIRAFEQLPLEAQPDAKGNRYHRFYNVLPPAFETSEAVELAGKMNIATRTAKRYLNTLIDEHKLTRIRKGKYEKVG